jgi:hypothetical protein
VADDNGRPVLAPAASFCPAKQRGGWEPCAESFVRLNTEALKSLDVRIEFGATASGTAIRLVPGGRVGAVPLRHSQTGHVVGGMVVRPRFGWAGAGQILAQTGWHAMPELHPLSAVPGSAREVPAWVLAGPVLARLTALLQSARRGYHSEVAVLSSPRGRILWDQYRNTSLVRGQWHRLPCRFPELSGDPQIRRFVRWAVERVLRSLRSAGGTDPVADQLADLAVRLLALLSDVSAQRPNRSQLAATSRYCSVVVQRGLEALSWIAEDRGLGDVCSSEGVAWSLSLEALWERFVEAVVRSEAALTGGRVSSAFTGDTTVRVDWSDPVHRSLGHLAPDIVVRNRDNIHVVDAKYKSHLAELDEHQWRDFESVTRDAHRADIHQILAYASLFHAQRITATLVYPLRLETWKALRRRGRDVSVARLSNEGREITLELRGLPFGLPRATGAPAGPDNLVTIDDEIA